ncbi:MAG: hypothetical protein AB7V46_04735 [Thermomicrobiales bacterium]
MRNLAGRLTARTNQELMRIAEFWQVVVGGRDRHTVVGQLYREMREVRSARDVRERLNDRERAVIRQLALDDEDERSWTLPALSAALGWAEQDTREVAIALYRKGILYREGDDDELPVGELPRVFLPRELTASFRRVQDEIDAGSLDRVPFPALLALLDDTEIDQAATDWGIEVLPGLQDREELTRQLVQAIQEPDRRASILAGLSADARDLWSRMMERDGPSALQDIVSEVRALEGDGIAASQRRRNAIGQLEERLLVWHSYGPDEKRMLFTPAEMRQRRRMIEREARAPQPVSEAIAVAPWLHRWAVPWDLMTLLRGVSASHQQEVSLIAPSRTWLEQIAARLWIAGGEDQTLNYLTFLAALGQNENVLQVEEAADARVQPGRSWKHWRSYSFSEQFSHLVWWWTASPDWNECAVRTDVIVRNAALPQFRRKLLALIDQLEAGEWFECEAVGRWIAEVDPDILGEDAAIATAASFDVPAGHPEWGKRATSLVIQRELETALTWFGFIETGTVDSGRQVMRTTDALRAIQSENAVVDDAQPAGPAMLMLGDGTIELRIPSPVRVWALSAFATLVHFRPAPTYRITEQSLRRALSQGPVVGDVISYLESETGEALHATVREDFEKWAQSERAVRVRRLIELTPDSESEEERLRTLLREGGWDLDDHGRGLQVLLSEEASADQQHEALITILRRSGYQIKQYRPPDRPLSENGESGGP